ncbi:MAG: hypothetical protein QRY72_03275 [Candidatus Rhabdochlamydia sp.]
MSLISFWGEKISSYFPRRISFTKDIESILHRSFVTEKDIESFEMKDIEIPTYPIDVFDKVKILKAKEIFKIIPKPDDPELMTSHIFKNCFQSFLNKEVTSCIEGYYVDQHLSSRISLENILKLFQIVKDQAPKLSKMSERDEGCLYTDSYSDFHEVPAVERLFMDRINIRLAHYLEKQVYEEIGPPAFENKANVEHVEDAIRRGCPLVYSDLIFNRVASEKMIYDEYKKRLYEERDKRAFKWLEEALAKDQAVRAINPEAPLSHLVMLPSFEQEIRSKRVSLLKEIILIPTCLALSITAIYLAIKHRKLIQQMVTAVEAFPVKLGYSKNEAKVFIYLGRMMGAALILRTRIGFNIVTFPIFMILRVIDQKRRKQKLAFQADQEKEIPNL